MTRRLCVVLACALALLGVASGCGGASHPKTGPTTGLSVAQIKRLNQIDSAKTLAACKQAALNPGLPANVKPLIDIQCEDIRTGNNAGLHAIDRQICKAEAALQPEPLRTKLKAQCKQL